MKLNKRKNFHKLARFFKGTHLVPQTENTPLLCIIVCLTSCFTYLNSTKQVNLLLIKHSQSS